MALLAQQLPSATPDQARMLLGEALYPMVDEIEPASAAKKQPGAGADPGAGQATKKRPKKRPKKRLKDAGKKVQKLNKGGDAFSASGSDRQDRRARNAKFIRAAAKASTVTTGANAFAESGARKGRRLE